MNLAVYAPEMPVVLDRKGASPITGHVVSFSDDGDEYIANVEQWLVVHLDSDARPEGVRKFRRPNSHLSTSPHGWHDSKGKKWTIRPVEGGGA